MSTPEHKNDVRMQVRVPHDVPVQYAATVEVVDSRHNLSDIIAGIGLVDRPAVADSRHQVAAAAVFHHQVETVLCFHDIEQLHDVVVSNPLEQSRFPPHVAPHVTVRAGLAFVDHLDGHLADSGCKTSHRYYGFSRRCTYL